MKFQQNTPNYFLISICLLCYSLLHIPIENKAEVPIDMRSSEIVMPCHVTIVEDTKCLTLLDHFVTIWQTDNTGTSNSTSITIPTFSGETYNYDVDWDNDGVFDEFGITSDATHDYGVAGTVTIRIQGTFPRIYFNNGGDKEKIIDIEQWGNIAWTSMEKAFFGAKNLISIASDVPDLSGVTDMTRMFSSASSFNGDISSWNVANVIDMWGLFSSASSFNSDISSWNVTNVTDMWLLFSDANSFNQNLGQWNIGSVTDMSSMLNNSGLSLNNYDNTLIGWESQGVNNLTLGASNLSYCGGEAARNSLINTYDWTITGDAKDCTIMPCSVTITGDSLICLGQSTTLTANFLSGSGTFNWNDFNQSTTQSITVSPPQDRTYVVVYNDLVNNCTVIDSICVIIASVSIEECPPDQIIFCDDEINLDDYELVLDSSHDGITYSIDTTLVINGNPNCSGTEYTYTYTLTDECGNISDCDQIFTIQNDAPVISCPSNTTVECESDIVVGALSSSMVTTSCNVSWSVSTDLPIIDGVAGCDGTTYSYNYVITDDCGGSANCQQIFTLSNGPPMINCPDDVTVECFDEILPIAGDAMTTVSCGLNSSVSISSVIEVGPINCPGSICIFTYTVEDECGRTASCEQIFAFENDDPTIIMPSHNPFVNCESDIVLIDHLSFPEVLINTSCNLEATVFISDTIINGIPNCDGTTYTYVYTVEDECGQTASDLYTFIINHPLPTIECPPDYTVSCEDEILIDPSNVLFFHTCEVASNVSIIDTTIVGNPNCSNTTYTYTYQATDTCGTVVSCEQVFTIQNLEPSINCRPDTIVTCVEDIMVSPLDIEVTSGCGLDGSEIIDIQYPLVSNYPNCPGNVYTYVFVVTDACQNTASCSRSFTIDNSAPVITSCPLDMTVACPAEIVLEPNNVTYTVSCHLGSTVSVSEPEMSVSPTTTDSTYTYTYYVEDECARKDSCTQVFTIIPNPVQIIGDTEICADQSTTLYAAGGSGNYLWQADQSTGSSILVTPNGQSSIYMILYDQGICPTSDAVDVQVNPVAEITLASNSPICEGEDIQLFETEGFAGVIEWTGPNNFSSTSQNPVIPNATLSNSGIYYLIATTVAGCQTITPIEVLIESCCEDFLYVGSSIPSDLFEANINILSDGNIFNSENVTFHGGVDIDLTAGFCVDLGAEFLAEIAPCGSSFRSSSSENRNEKSFSFDILHLGDFSLILFEIQNKSPISLSILETESGLYYPFLEEQAFNKGQHQYLLDTSQWDEGKYLIEMNIGSSLIRKSIKK